MTSKKIPTYRKMPDCKHHQLGSIRYAGYPVVHKHPLIVQQDTTEYVLEVLFEDGYGNPFWGPIPVVDNPETEDG